MYPAALATLLSLARLQMEQLTERLQRKEIDSDEWQSEMLHLITRYSIAALLLALDTDALDAQAQQVVNRQVESQVTYLKDFKREIEQAEEWDASWIQRAGMYGEAVQPLYWQGITRFLKLPAYPGDGSAECLVFDRCMWVLDWLDESQLDVDAYWVDLKDGRVCPTCLERATKWSPLRIRNGVIIQ